MGFFDKFFISKDTLKENVKKLTEQHVETLSRKRKMLIKFDDYGRMIDEDWNKEIRYFIHSHNILNFDDYRNDINFIMEILYLIDDIIFKYEQKQKNNDSYIEFDDNMTPNEYEYFCADILVGQGFDARVTKQSGDQGADIIVYNENNPFIVIQCKLYSSPIGNKAVQEISSAKYHYGARIAIVVSNHSYTKSAIELANTNDVLLIHHDDLRDFMQLLEQFE